MKDCQIETKQIADSRGRPTIQVSLRTQGVVGIGDVPAGASTGEDEAATVPVDQAIHNIHHEIYPRLRNSGFDLVSHENLLRLEKIMIEHAGPNFRDWGANAVLPISRALWKAAAQRENISLWAYVRKYEPELSSRNRVYFYMNIFNGGLHALKKINGEILGKDRIDVQEIMVVPTSATSYQDALIAGEKIDQALKKILIEKFEASMVTRADEAGFSVKGLGDSTEAFTYVIQAIKDAGYEPGRDVKLALDVAASSFYDTTTQKYLFQGHLIDSDKMIHYLCDLVDSYPNMMLSIEDGLAENDWEAWTRLSSEMKKRKVITIGDDLFVTQMPRLKTGIDKAAAHAILIKVNQNGTVHGTLEVMKHAQKHGMQSVISHRSGETLDDSIADLAIATGAMGLKTGDPQPENDFPDPSTWVRRRKYLRMIEIESNQTE